MTVLTEIAEIKEQLIRLNRVHGLISSPATAATAENEAYIFVKTGGVNKILSALERLEVAEARVKELEGEQVPVAIWEIVNPGEGTYFSVHDPRPEDVVSATYGKLPFTAPQKPVVVGYRNKFTGMIWNLEHQLGAETDPLVYEPVYLTAPQKPASLPVGEIVTWSGTKRHMGITREVDFRFLRFDVMPGTKLYAIESESSDKKSDLLTRAEALAVETRALANQIQAGE